MYTIGTFVIISQRLLQVEWTLVDGVGKPIRSSRGIQRLSYKQALFRARVPSADVRLVKAKMRFYTAGMIIRAILDVAAGRLCPDLARARMRDTQARISISRIG